MARSFALNIPIRLLAIADNAALLPASARRNRPQLDLVGAVLMVVGVSGVLLAVQWGGQSFVWNSWQVLLSLLDGLTVLVGFVLWEQRTAEPIVPMRLFRERAFSILNLGSFLLGCTFSGLLIYLTVFVRRPRCRDGVEHLLPHARWRRRWVILRGVLLTLRLTSLDTIDSETPQAYVAAMTPIFLVVAAFAVVIFVTTLFVPDQKLRDLDEEALALAELGVTEH